MNPASTPAHLPEPHSLQAQIEESEYDDVGGQTIGRRRAAGSSQVGPRQLIFEEAVDPKDVAQRLKLQCRAYLRCLQALLQVMMWMCTCTRTQFYSGGLYVLDWGSWSQGCFPEAQNAVQGLPLLQARSHAPCVWM